MILSDNETRLDLLNNRAIAKTIVDIIKDSKESVSIGVHGDWGAGKSSILAMVEEMLVPEFDNYDDSDWDDWDELNEPDDASDEEPETVPSGYAVIRFNSWKYQGFEDAKIALMSEIVKTLQKKAKEFYKEHPVKGALNKLKDICKTIWENIDKIGLAKNIGKIGVTLATGTTPMALLNIGTGYVKDIFKDKKKMEEFIGVAGELMKKQEADKSTYKEMNAFRANYSDLFDAAHIEKLVVLIDDLDRCLPKVAIETLEAVRMFLDMENTAFIIAADDEMIRYAVRESFPRIIDKDTVDGHSVDYNRFSDKYLEKLIQVPFHIPRIGVAEAQLYVMLLLIETRLGETKEMELLAEAAIARLKKPWSLEQFSNEEIKSILGEYYETAINEVRIANSIDTVLAKHTEGNPRNIKRFVNMLILRTNAAYNRGFDEKELEMVVLAKMMLAEQYYPDFYKGIPAELREDGTCPAFESKEQSEEDNKTEEESEKEGTGSTKGRRKKPTEEKAATSAKPMYTNEEFGTMLTQDEIKAWLSIDPPLENIDLRPYFFACTEKEDFFFSSPEERLRELVSVILAGKMNAKRKKDEIEKLNISDAKQLFRKVSKITSTKKLYTDKTPKEIEGIRVLVEYRPELQVDLCDFLMTLQFDTVGVWATGGWDTCIPKDSPNYGKLKEFFKEVENRSSSSITRSAAKSAQRE